MRLDAKYFSIAAIEFPLTALNEILESSYRARY